METNNIASSPETAESIQIESSTRRRSGYRLVFHKLFVRGLPKDFDGYTFVHLSDFHYGPLNSWLELDRAIGLAATFEPDLVLLTGDYVQNGRIGFHHTLATKFNPEAFHWLDYRRRVRELAKDFSRALSRLTPRDGILASFGNHDHLEGIGTLQRQLEPPISFLRNTATTIHRGMSHLWVSGIDDLNRGELNLQQALAPDVLRHHTSNKDIVQRSSSDMRTSAAFRILLSHNPDVVLLPQQDIVREHHLVLAGHTHGGQIRIPLFGAPITRTRQREHVWGLGKHGDTLVNVTSGVGYGAIRLRLFCPPEIVIFRLERGG